MPEVNLNTLLESLGGIQRALEELKAECRELREYVLGPSSRDSPPEKGKNSQEESSSIAPGTIASPGNEDEIREILRHIAEDIALLKRPDTTQEDNSRPESKGKSWKEKKHVRIITSPESTLIANDDTTTCNSSPNSSELEIPSSSSSRDRVWSPGWKDEETLMEREFRTLEKTVTNKICKEIGFDGNLRGSTVTHIRVQVSNYQRNTLVSRRIFCDGKLYTPEPHMIHCLERETCLVQPSAETSAIGFVRCYAIQDTGKSLLICCRMYRGNTSLQLGFVPVSFHIPKNTYDLNARFDERHPENRNRLEMKTGSCTYPNEKVLIVKSEQVLARVKAVMFTNASGDYNMSLKVMVL